MYRMRSAWRAWLGPVVGIGVAALGCMGRSEIGAGTNASPTGDEVNRGGDASPRPQATLPVNILDHAADAEGRPLRVLAGTELTVMAIGEPSATVDWQLAYEETVLAEGKCDLDSDGGGRFRLVLPEVRHRAACQLLLLAGDRRRVREIVVFPSSMLGASKTRIAEHRLGVIDPSGGVQRALVLEGVPFEDLATDIEQRFFDGGTVILAGYESGEALAAACQGLEERLEKGMSVLIFNPPVGWSGWGAKHVAVEEARSAAVRLAEDFGRILQGADLGEGPWESVLEVESNGGILIGLAPAEEKDAETVSPGPAQSLAVARRVGRGWAVVTMLPQLERPASDAVGRALLAELILWTVRTREDPKEKEESHVR
jgi:hypothetical protein